MIDTRYVLQVDDDTSSANNGFPHLGAPSATHMDSHAEMPQIGAGAGGMPGLMTQASIPESEAYGEEEANKKDTAAADDLRELAAKGVCAPLWRTNQPVQPVQPPTSHNTGCLCHEALASSCTQHNVPAQCKG